MAAIRIKKIGGFNLKKKLRLLQRAKANHMPRLIANMAKNHFLEGFRKGAKKGGGQTDDSSSGWDRRKKETRQSRRRSILVKEGDLRKSIKVIAATWEKIIVGSREIPYAEIHNEGGIINATQSVPAHTRRSRGQVSLVKEHTRRMKSRIPKREFIGKSKKLERQIKNLVVKELDKILK